MNELFKSMGSFFLATSLFGIKQLQNLASPGDRDERRNHATNAFDAVTNSTTAQFGETLKSLFRAMDNVQRGIIGIVTSTYVPSQSSDWRGWFNWDPRHGRRDGADRENESVPKRWANWPTSTDTDNTELEQDR